MQLQASVYTVFLKNTHEWQNIIDTVLHGVLCTLEGVLKMTEDQLLLWWEGSRLSSRWEGESDQR